VCFLVGIDGKILENKQIWEGSFVSLFKLFFSRFNLRFVSVFFILFVLIVIVFVVLISDNFNQTQDFHLHFTSGLFIGAAVLVVTGTLLIPFADKCAFAEREKNNLNNETNEPSQICLFSSIFPSIPTKKHTDTSQQPGGFKNTTTHHHRSKIIPPRPATLCFFLNIENYTQQQNEKNHTFTHLHVFLLFIIKTVPFRIHFLYTVVDLFRNLG
jgi:hypothetical protein